MRLKLVSDRVPDGARRRVSRAGARALDRHQQRPLGRGQRRRQRQRRARLRPGDARRDEHGEECGRGDGGERKSGQRARFAHQGGGSRARRHPDLRRVDFADVLAVLAGPTDRADDHRLQREQQRDRDRSRHSAPRRAARQGRGAPAPTRSMASALATTIRARCSTRRGRSRSPTPGVKPRFTPARGRQDRPAHGAHGGRRAPRAGGVFPRLRRGRARPDRRSRRARTG